MVCGVLFGIAAFFSPIFAEVPPAGTAPLLLMVGVLLFQNAKRIDWSYIGKAVPSYCCLFFIPFTYSILRGVGFGYVSYIIIGMFTGDFWIESAQFLTDYLIPKKVDPKESIEGSDKAGGGGGGGGGAFTVTGLVGTLMSLDMTYSDDNVVPITQEFETSTANRRSIGNAAEDVSQAEHILARDLAKEKMRVASDAFSKLLKEAEFPQMNRQQSHTGRHASFKEVAKDEEGV